MQEESSVFLWGNGWQSGWTVKSREGKLVMKRKNEYPEEIQRWIAEATAAIEAPEKRDQEMERILRQIEAYQAEMAAWPEEQRTRRILDKLGTVKNYQRGLASEKEMKSVKLKKQLRILGITALILCVVFAWGPVQIIREVGIGYVGNLHWYAAQLFTGRMIAASLWLVVGIALLVSGFKKKK